VPVSSGPRSTSSVVMLSCTNVAMLRCTRRVVGGKLRKVQLESVLCWI
jgi:hypothetical protein